ncbi:CHAT domain-containing protein [Nostoc sp. CHAB 5844]|nr:CHAT domain-containing protein [Nostoc sp. CHAB 5844]
MHRVIFSLYLVGLSFICVSSASIAQTKNPSMPPGSTQPSVDANSPQSSEADRLFEQGKQQLNQGQLQKALQTFQQVLKMRRQAGDRQKQADTIVAIADVYQKQKQYQQALEQYQQALVIVRDIRDRPREAQIWYAIGTTHNILQQYSQAIEAYQQALPLFRDTRNLFAGDPNIELIDISIGQIHFSIGQIYSTLGRYSKSQEYLNKSVELLQSALVKARANKNPQIERLILTILLGSYSSFSKNYAARQQYEQAIGYLQKALEFAKQLGNREQEKGLLEELVVNYANQGLTYQAQRNYEGALKSLQQALKFAQENDLQRWQGQVLLYIGQIYSSRQDFAQALNYQQQAQAIAKQTNDRFLQILLFSNQGSIYKNLLRYPEALEAFQQARSLLQETGDSLGAGSMLFAIGEIYANQNQYEKALNSYNQALETLKNNPFAPFKNGINADNVEKFCGVAQKVGASEGLFSAADNCTLALALGSEALKQPFVLDGLNSLLKQFNRTLLTLRGGTLHAIGQLYLKQKNYSQALASYQQARPILHQAGSVIEGATLGDMGIIYLLQRQSDQALAFSQQALKISRAFNHRINEEDALNNLAIVYWAQGNVPSALKTLSQKAQVENENLTNNLAIGSEERKQAYIAGQTDSISMTVTFHLQAAPQNSEAARLALTSVLQRKGRILDAVSDNIQRLRQNLQPEDQKLLNHLNTFRAALVNLFYDRQNTLSAQAFKTQSATLKAKITELEDALAQHSTEFRSEVQPVTIEAVQALIPADAALVEFVRYSPYNPKANVITSEVWGTPRYAAAILTPKGNLKWVDLGVAAEIDQLAIDFRAALATGKTFKKLARTLDQKLIAPIRPLLDNARHILISPDGQLTLIPFEALIDEQDKFLIQRYAFSYLTSGRDLLRFQSNVNNASAPVVLADIDYDNQAQRVATTKITEVQAGNNRHYSELANLEFDSLPATKDEAAAIKNVLPNAKVLLGKDATETAVKQLHSPSILHLATHGFFVTGVKQNTLQVENPLLRSGLALAGFNKRKQATNGNDDGVLTALEVAGLDLRSNQLVVLSACDTGKGDVKVGEGVYGLRRALVTAGSQSQVLSLWLVDDAVTKELMVKYYQNLKISKGRHEALRAAQLELLNSKEYDHPLYWAAFVPSGNWTRLNLK